MKQFEICTIFIKKIFLKIKENYMNELDIFNPQVSTVAKGLEGKVILVYGGNN